MKEIWYLLKCPKGNEAEYVQKYQELTDSKNLQEVVCFEYHRMMRYGGSWHLERRTLLPGCIFLVGTADIKLKERAVPLIPCESPYLKELCQEDNLIAMSKGIIKAGKTIVTNGPLKGRERLIKRIDRHKRTAEIEIFLSGQKEQVTVGLEIYEKQ
ncbi:hypothetical protein D3Z51_11720 [Clostridiaceae bacterium]|nr:hypothetical protein [Clostridiaceae bacterium]RKI12937.1 hypothetical protein D7V81_11320 [bacterium 1XD21-70]